MAEEEAVAKDAVAELGEEAEASEADEEATMAICLAARPKVCAQPWAVMFLTATRKELQNK